ncbi:MAG TPA: hypothetical protein VNT26_24370 [Candidatus Sulfotelmatobacter sp.]|nr:hypothetical protein [Candidatus Sulfotelmatobacter sp.]
MNGNTICHPSPLGRVCVALRTAWVLLAATVTWGTPASTQVGATNTTVLSSFELPDQYGHQHQCDFSRSSITVLTLADKQGAEQIPGWVQALKARFGSRINLEGVADVSSVPGVFRSMVRKGLREKFQYPIMLDWEGKVVSRFQLAKGMANVFLVARNGQLLLSAQGPAESNQLAKVFAAIERQL